MPGVGVERGGRAEDAAADIIGDINIVAVCHDMTADHTLGGDGIGQLCAVFYIICRDAAVLGIGKRRAQYGPQALTLQGQEHGARHGDLLQLL